jgi:hypothetical protein
VEICAGCRHSTGSTLFYAAGTQVDVLGLANLAAALGEDERDFLEFGIDAVAMFQLNDVAFDDVAILANHFYQLTGHYFRFCRV